MIASVTGVDLSLACTGICLPDGTTDHIHGTKVGTLYNRAYKIRDELRHWLFPAGDLIVVEAIGTRHVQTAISMAYLHCMFDGTTAGQRVLKVDPATVKRFATGKGTADKHAMTVAAVRNGWVGSDDSTDDEADAWWLWALGRHVLGDQVAPDTAFRKDIAAKLKAQVPA